MRRRNIYRNIYRSIYRRVYREIYMVVGLVIMLGILGVFSPGVLWSEGAKELKFERGDTLEVLREKIDNNGYNFKVGHNWVYDMTPEQKEVFFSRRMPRVVEYELLSDDIGPLSEHLGKRALPSSFDWRNYNGKAYIGSVRNQGDCGSCYSFGAAAAAEGTYNYATGRYNSNCINFSESFIAWCLGGLSQYYDHFYGCDGADYDYYELQALVDYGITYESNFPYQDYEPGSCTHWSDPRIKFTSWHRVPCRDVNAIKTAIMTYGVVDAAVEVTSGFEAYESGIYQDSNTGCSGYPCYYTSTNHAIALVGWDDSQGVWILRNSWGSSWGENGYMRIKYHAAAVSCAVTYLVYTSSETPTITVTSPNGGETWTQGSSRTISWTTTGTVGNVKIEYTSNNGTSWSTIVSSTGNDGSYTWTVPVVSSTQCKVRISEAGDSSPTDTSNAVFTISTGSSGKATISLNRTALNFGALAYGTGTGAQELWVGNSGSGTLNWKVSDNASWLTCSPASGSNGGIISISISADQLSTGSYSGTVTVSASNCTNSPQTVSVNLEVMAYWQEGEPFGVFETPVSGSTIRSSVPVTGWVLDDIEVDRVELYAGQTYIGDAIFVEGARPDVEAGYPSYPFHYRAGWGYMLLSYYLPNGGQGYQTIYARAIDSTGNAVYLGSTTVYVDNNSAVKPFGALEKPEQGETVSGNKYTNWGWALTPMPNSIATNGSKINVVVDGVNKGHPKYNLYRSDIATFFPGYANSNGAVGYYDLDTTTYDNGLHTIQWTATDSGGNTDGIGSRYFSVMNTGASRQETAAQNLGLKKRGFLQVQSVKEVTGIPGIEKPVWVKKGYHDEELGSEVLPGKGGLVCLQMEELERLVIGFEERSGAVNHEFVYSGWLVGGDQLRPLPAGSTLDQEKGIFYWSPGPGFVGSYRLVFFKRGHIDNDGHEGMAYGQQMEKIDVDVEIVPKKY